MIVESLSTSPTISPTEWKHTIYTITKYYPEIISQDHSDDENYGHGIRSQVMVNLKDHQHYLVKIYLIHIIP